MGSRATGRLGSKFEQSDVAKLLYIPEVICAHRVDCNKGGWYSLQTICVDAKRSTGMLT